jgi:hypothetical protein
MDKLKKIGYKLLYPHILILILLVPIAIGLLVWSMLTLGTTHLISIISYVLAFYTLTIVCFRIPDILKVLKKIKNGNKYIIMWRNNSHLRMKISLIASFVFNIIYAIFQFFIGLYHGSFWFYSMFAYYLILAVMRYLLMRHTLTNEANTKPKSELLKYCFCGWMMLVLNIALTLIVFFMVYWNRTFNHHPITTIALAAYTFASFAIAIINFIKYRKFKSPVYSAAKSISLTSACVSIITLESTMLTVFGSDMDVIVRKILLGCSGGVVSIFVVLLAINIIFNGKRQLKKLIKK